MKVKVKQEFRDRANGLKLRKKDESFEVDDKRGKYLISLGLVEEIKEEATSKKDAATG